MQIYISVNKSFDVLESGTYYYNSNDHTICRVSDFCCNGANGNELTFHFLSKLDAIKPLYEKWAKEFCELESGYMAALVNRMSRKLEVEITKKVLNVDFVSLLGCGSDSLYHFSFEVNFAQKNKGQLILNDSSNNVEIYVYVKSDRVSKLSRGIYKLINGELTYVDVWHTNDESLHQDGLTEAILNDSALVVIFSGDDNPENNYYAGEFSQYFMETAITYKIGCCAIGHLINKNKLHNKFSDRIIHTIAVGSVSESQIESHEYSEPKEIVWDIKKYLNIQLEKTLPAYMLPEQYIIVERIPLSLNGKVDIKALPKPDSTNKQLKGYVAPQNEIEQMLTDIWCKVLGLDKVGIYDNFFDVGGDSVKVVQTKKYLDNKGFSKIKITDLFKYVTINSLANKLQRSNQDTLDDIVDENRINELRKKKKNIENVKRKRMLAREE
ncbi:MAG: phosphopantetheine-binding protein [Actinobacteria bacterium]|nr:phosphopantetheine-binding protein [Actinomycetota bacterium]